MQLKVSKDIRKAIITVELETINFTHTENKMLDQFGEPVINFEAMYEDEFAVSIHKKIRSNFKVRVRFDGTKDIDKATRAANDFIEQIHIKVVDEMEKFIDKVEFVDIEAGQSVLNVTSHNHPPVYPRFPHGGYNH